MCNGISPIGVQQPICSKHGLCFAKKMICTLMPIIRYFICQENLVVNHSALIHIKEQKCTNGDIDWDSECKILLFYPEVCWLSRESCSESNFEMRDNIKTLLCDTTNNSLDHFYDFTLFAQVAYLSNIFSIRNRMTLSLQDQNVCLFFFMLKLRY